MGEEHLDLFAQLHRDLVLASLGDAARKRRLQQVTQQRALSKPSVAVLGKGRVIRGPVTQVDAAELTICQVQMHLFAEPPLGPDGKAIALQQHPDQQFGIDRWTAPVAVEIRKMGADSAQVDEPVHGPKQVVLGDVILQRELVEQSRLRLLPRPHHRQPSRPLKQCNVPQSSRVFQRNKPVADARGSSEEPRDCRRAR